MARSLRDWARLVARAAFPSSSGGPAGQLSPMALFPSARGDAPVRGSSNVLDGYSSLPWLRAVTGRIAQALAATDWQLYAVRKPQQRAVKHALLQRASPVVRRKMLGDLIDTDNADEITVHPLLDLLDQGNPHHTGVQLWRLTSASMDLVGEVYWLLQRNGVGAPAALWPIPPTWVLEPPVPGRDSYRVNFKGRYADVPTSEMIALLDPNPADPYGRGTGLAAALGDELATDEYAAKLVKEFFLSGARPDFILWPKEGSSTMGLDPGERTRFERDWLNRHQGYQRAYRPYVAGQELGVHEFSKDFRSMEMTDLRRYERDTIIQTYGMPPEMLGVLESCHDADTECLTRAGWKHHADLSVDDEVATWNADAQVLEYQHPTEVLRFEHDGPMHHWIGKRLDVLVTPQHRMYRQDSKGQWAMLTSEEHRSERGWFQWRATGGGYDGGDRIVVIPPHTSVRPTQRPDDDGPRAIAADTFAYFLGVFIAEGWAQANGQVFLSQNDGAVADKMWTALESLDMGAVGERRRPIPATGNLNREMYLCHRGLASWLREHVGTGARHKRLPACVFGWTREAQERLLDGMIDGDGHRNANGGVSYGTASEALADDLQRLLVQMGYPAYKDAGRSQKQPLWSVQTRRSQTPHRNGNAALVVVGDYEPNPAWVREEQYTGTVWCVTVPNGLFFTRRNGRVILHGNSNRATITAAEYIFARWVLVPRLELLRSILQERLVPEFDDRLVLDYVSPVPDDAAQALEAAKAAPHALTVNEWRGMAGKPPVPDGEVYMVPPTLMPVSSLSEAPEPMVEEPEPPDLPAVVAEPVSGPPVTPAAG